EKVWGGSYTNGYSEYYYTRTVVDGVAGPDIGYDTYYVEPTYKTLTMGTKEHYKIVNVTTTTPIIAGKVVTEDPNKSASESYLVEGTNGSIVETVEIKYYNGVETSRSVISSVTNEATMGEQLIGLK